MRELKLSLGSYEAAVADALANWRAKQTVERLWAHDHTVWKPDPTEIGNRLGWLEIADWVKADVGRLKTFTRTVQDAGYTHALLLGMGGSSLAPELFFKTFGSAPGHLALGVLDSTDPGAVLTFERQLDMSKTLFIVATKSGGTVETLSGFKYFYNRVQAAVGREHTGEHFIAITDPESSLVALGEKYAFREIFLNDPNIGGRYSALSLFGLVPAALIGVDLDALLDSAISMRTAYKDTGESNPAARLGAAMGELAKQLRDKLTIVGSGGLASFGDWAEQLIAESTGKEGKGILPVVGEALGDPSVYGDDRAFVYLKLNGDTEHDAAVDALERAGHPTARLEIDHLIDVGGLFLLFELATALAGQRLAINPFDQPNVEAAKILARDMVAEYLKSGSLPTEEARLERDGIAVYTQSPISASDPAAALGEFLSQAGQGAYIALQAYVEATPATERKLQEIRVKMRDKTRLATTLGYGPRFLHSTGQLHKGDAGRGLFIQFTANDAQDTPIPDEAGADASRMSFGVLKMSQALGDAAALRNAGRKVIRLHFERLDEGLIRVADGL